MSGIKRIVSVASLATFVLAGCVGPNPLTPPPDPTATPQPVVQATPVPPVAVVVTAVVVVQKPATAASAASQPGQGTNVIDMLDDGRSLEPRSTNVLDELGYPPYRDTGVGKTANYQFNVPDGWTAIVGGVVVGNSRQGNLIAYKGPTTVTTNVTDGFYVVKMNEDAHGEFCAHLDQHLRNGWLVRNVVALSEWGNRPCSPA